MTTFLFLFNSILILFLFLFLFIFINDDYRWIIIIQWLLLNRWLAYDINSFPLDPTHWALRYAFLLVYEIKSAILWIIIAFIYIFQMLAILLDVAFSLQCFSKSFHRLHWSFCKNYHRRADLLKYCKENTIFEYYFIFVAYYIVAYLNAFHTKQWF